MQLVIDPGHGGKNTGCQYNGILEKEFTLAAATRLLSILQEGLLLDMGLLTRAGDDDRSLEERGMLSAQADADLVISIHADGNADPSVGFLSCYAMPGDSIGRAVGEEIERAAPEALRPRVPSITLVRPGDWTERAYNVLHHHAPRAAVLVECGFLSNPRHAAYLKTENGQLALLAALVAGVAKGWELMGSSHGG